MLFALLWLGNRNLPALGECWRAPVLESSLAAADAGEHQHAGVLTWKVFSSKAATLLLASEPNTATNSSYAVLQMQTWHQYRFAFSIVSTVAFRVVPGRLKALGVWILWFFDGFA